MPRRNFLLILTSALISLMCYKASDRNPYGRYFSEVMEQIGTRYVNDVDQQSLFNAAVRGMMSELDENSAFIDRAETNEFHQTLDQQFGGIGIEVTVDKDSKRLTVMSPIVGTPAYEAGLLAGDTILAIDGESTVDFTSKDAVKRIRGRPGDPVELTIRHAGEEEETTVSIPRAIIQVDSVLGDTRNSDGSWNFSLHDHPSIGYVRITSFGEKTVDELKSALAQIQERSREGLILDLRWNPGGLLTAAVEVCDLFIDNGVIVSIRGRNDEIRDVHHASSGGVYSELPLAILVNEYSASASEIVAACLQDHNRAVVVGQRSYGKGTVQNLIDVEGGRSVLKLTIADYWRPNNKNIHRHRDAKETDEWGVTPNESYAIPLDKEQQAALFQRRRERDVVKPAGSADDGPVSEFSDSQLQRALEYLDSRIDKKGVPKNAA